MSRSILINVSILQLHRFASASVTSWHHSSAERQYVQFRNGIEEGIGRWSGCPADAFVATLHGRL